jgi:hypothetical protein
MAADLITASEHANPNIHIGLVSDDNDLLPAIAAASMRLRGNMSLTLLRFYAGSSYLDSYLVSRGVRIVQVKTDEGGDDDA